MKNQENTIPQNATQVIHLAKCAVHKLANKKKEKIYEGSCRVYSMLKSSQDTPNQNYDSYILKVKKFILKIQENMSFAMINYPETTSFLFEHNDNCIYALSFHKNCENLQKFQAQLNRIATIAEYKSDQVKPELKQKINEASKNDVQSKDIWTDKSLVKTVGKNMGIFIGKISNVVSKPTIVAGNAISDRADRFSRDSISQETKSKFTNVTSKIETANQTVNTALKPVINKCEGLADELGKSFLASQNKIIAAIRQYSFALRDSLNQGEKSALQKESIQQQMKQESSQVQFNVKMKDQQADKQ